MLELTDRQAFNASMEHMYENQQPDEAASYEQYIQDIHYGDQSLDEIVDSIKRFSIKLLDETPEALETLGSLMNGALHVSSEIIDSETVSVARRMFTSGAVTGLYIGSQMAGEYMSTARVLETSRELIKDDVYKFVDDATTFAAHMNPITKHILDKWKVMGDSDEKYGTLFDIGFGVTMCSVNKTLYEINLFRDLENITDWSEPINEIAPESSVVPVDDDCLMLAKAFQSHVDTAQFDQLTLAERRAALQRIAELLVTDFSHTEKLRLEDCVQTRGLGACISYNENDEPEDMYGYNEAIKFRGRLARVDCMSVPTEFSMLMGNDEEYEPQVCLVLDNVELIEPSGEKSPHDNNVAIPLRASGTTQLDKIINPTEQS